MLETFIKVAVHYMGVIEMNKETEKKLLALRDEALSSMNREKIQEIKQKVHKILITQQDCTLLEHWLFIIGGC